MKKNRKIITQLTLSIILLVVSFIGYILDKQRTIYEETKTNLIFKSEGTISYNETTANITEHINEEYYIIGKNGTIIENKEKVDEDILNTIGDYIIYFDITHGNYPYYYINTKTNYKSKDSTLIVPIYNNDECTHLLLYSEDNNDILLVNVKNDMITQINKRYKFIFKEFKDGFNQNIFTKLNSKNDKYIISGSLYKMGIIDYNGNKIIDLKYDDLTITSNKEHFIAKKDGKYGIIDINENIILEFEYDYLHTTENYIMAIKGPKMGILNKEYKIINNFEILIDSNKKDFYLEEINNLLYLHTFAKETANYYINPTNEILAKYTLKEMTTAKNHLRTYLIDETGKEVKVNEYLKPIKNNKKTYFYNETERHNSIEIDFYDEKLNRNYIFKIPINDSHDVFYTNIKKNKYNDYYALTVVFVKKVNDEYQKTAYIYYLDLENKKEITIDEYSLQNLDNECQFKLQNNELNIYCNKKLIGTYSNVTTYLGNNMFIFNNNEIHEIKFIK